MFLLISYDFSLCLFLFSLCSVAFLPWLVVLRSGAVTSLVRALPLCRSSGVQAALALQACLEACDQVSMAASGAVALIEGNSAGRAEE